ncbi:phosphatidylserine decarboxylase [Fusarium solani]
MVRIIPTRLKPSSRSSSSSSTTISVSNNNSSSRANSPPTRSKMDNTSPSRDAGNGLALRVSIIKVSSTPNPDAHTGQNSTQGPPSPDDASPPLHRVGCISPLLTATRLNILPPR